MIISYLGKDRFRIRTKDATINISSEKLDIDGFTIDNPGEYERKNVFVEVPFEQKAFRIMAEDITLLYPGKSKKFSEKQIEILDGIDLLFLPCGEEDSMSLKDALELSSTLEPSMIIPMLYSNIEALEKEGLEGEVSKSAKVAKSTLLEEGHQTIFLEIS
jgi:L-ascorbate metabolism protein UlaG (beta-lactamase superfamily)